jgi:transcriptional regulator with XRE-family HTH domain
LEPTVNEILDLYVGKRLRRRRRILGLSQAALGDLVGVRFQQIQKYEAGINRLSAARLWMLACALGVDVQYFYEGWLGERPHAALTAAQSRDQRIEAA